MRMTIDTDGQQVVIERDGTKTELPLYSKAAFEAISHLWMKVSWNEKYSYNFAWMGRPVIQLPEDMVRMQEVIWSVQPDVIIETGVAHGGSLIYYASLFQAMGKGRVVGVDIEIRADNRRAIESHPLAHRIQLVEGNSVSEETVAQAASNVHQGDSVMVILDSCHTYQHVADELEAYHRLVTSGSYIVATDGVMRDLVDVPRGQAGWDSDNPAKAAEHFAAAHPEFRLEQPAWPFRESQLTENITYWPNAWLRRT